MTKQAVKMMIKAAKKSALDHAMTAAERAGKPTSTGIVAGAGLGTIPAAIGALSRSGTKPQDQSALSNPLLLGTLGAAGGYLAGNAFERKKPTSSNHNMSLPALLGLVGGTGTIGTMLAHEDNKAILETKKQEFKDLIHRLHIYNHRNDAGNMVYSLNKKNIPDIDPATGVQKIKNGKPQLRYLTPEEIEEFKGARKGLAEAYLSTGNLESAISEANYSSKGAGGGFLRWLRRGRTSPWSWMKSLNPFKGPVSNATNAESGMKLLKSQLGKVIRENPKASGLAGLALLAGGGKAIYDYTKD